MRAEELPLFPLRSVLFPGGALRLQFGQPRHIDMIRWCAREARPFGVCTLLAEADAERGGPAAIGTEARIVDFHALPGGLLGIVAEGSGRFHVRRARIRDNGLIIAEVEALPTMSPQVRPEHALLVTLLDHLLEQVGGPHAKAERCRFDQADWVGYRLAELLPLSADERQGLLQCVDPHERLERLVHRLPELRG